MTDINNLMRYLVYVHASADAAWEVNAREESRYTAIRQSRQGGVSVYVYRFGEVSEGYA